MKLVYLGHEIGEGRLAVPENRVDHVADFIRPTIKKGVRAFLGTCGYYRKFVKDFGKLALPLASMTKKSELSNITLITNKELIEHPFRDRFWWQQLSEG